MIKERETGKESDAVPEPDPVFCVGSTSAVSRMLLRSQMFSSSVMRAKRYTVQDAESGLRSTRWANH
eukprot:3206275-Rhodomonas_salina.1